VLEIQFLGQFCVSDDGHRVSIRNPRLLAYLVLNRQRTLGRDEVAFALWPDSTDAQALTNLRRELHDLRRTLPDADRYLALDGRTIRWKPEAPAQLDVADMESGIDDAVGGLDRLRAGIDLYQGDLLPGIYDDWVRPHRDRLRGRFIEGLATLAARLEAHRDYQAAMAPLRRLVTLEPLDERAYRSLIRVAAAAGDRAAGLHAYHACVTALNDELGIAPSEETHAAYAALLAGDGSDPVSPLRGVGGRTQRLIGRAESWAGLLTSLDEARRGRPTMALLSGEPGIGKSHLAEELVRWARSQALTAAYARCYAAEGALAYAAPAAWLRTPPLFSALRHLDHAWLTELARLLPELLEEIPDLPAPAPMTQSWERPRLFEALTRGIRSAAPAVLVLDDANWSDDETLEWIHYLLRAEPAIPVLVLLAVRTEDLTTNRRLWTLLLDTRERIGLREIELAGLSEDETLELASLVADRPLDTAERSALFEETEGHPLLVVELARSGVVRDLVEGEPASALPEAVRAPAVAHLVPARMRAVIVARLAQLTPNARRLADLAAAWGRDFAFDALAAASDLEESEAVAALDELWQRRLVHERGTNRYDLSHDRIREVAYAEIAPARRRLLHRRIAQAIELVHGPELDVVAGQLAAHLEAGGQNRRAGDLYNRAADVAARVSAFAEAARHLDRALALLELEPPSRDRHKRELALLFRRSPALVAVEGYSSPRQEAAFARAQELAEDLGRPRDVSLAMNGSWSVCAVAGRTAEAIDLADRALARLSHPDDESSAYLAVGGAQGASGNIEASIAGFRVALERYRPGRSRTLMPAGADPAVFTCAWGSHALWLNGRTAEAMAWSVDAIRRADELQHPYSLTIAHSYALILAQLRDDMTALREQASAVGELCARYDFAYYEDWPTILGSWADRDTDDGAAARIERAIGKLTTLRAMFRRPYYLWLLADVHRAAGRRDAAIAALDEGLAVAEANGEHWWTPEIHRAAGELLEPEPEAAIHLRLAYQTAVGQGSHLLALRAAMSIVRRDPGQRDVLATAMAAMPVLSEQDRAVTEELLAQGSLPV
jgi:DNA-binding SARP family transcriptional activator/tetratricopeptide (TPR) repeat protein